MNVRSQEWPLVIFTLAAQVSVGMLIWLAMLSTINIPLPLDRLAVSGWSLALAVGALLSSLLHLGHPQRAILAMRRLNKSWISREVAIALAFCLSLLAFYLSELISTRPHVPNPVTSLALLWLSAILGAGLIFAMAQVYRLRTAPGWGGSLTGPIFFLSALLLGGSLLGWPLITTRLLPVGPGGTLMRLGLLICLGLQIGIALINVSRQSRTGLYGAAHLRALPFLRIGLLLAACVALILWQSVISTVMIIWAELLGRLDFYSCRTRLGV